ncbi:MAG: ABC-type cytochrome c biosis transport system permease component [Bacteroidota bacterium]|jgi:heme exporter protein B
MAMGRAGWFAVLEKDLRSEVRTRYGITSLTLFVVTSVILVAVSTADEVIPRPIISAVLWVVMFFTAMTGLARGFISEEERGTALYLRLSAQPLSVYIGKLVANTVLAVVSNLLAVALMTLLVPSLTIGAVTLLIVIVVLASIGLAAVTTITSAIVAKAGSKQALLPILAFPVLLPLIMPGVQATLIALAGLGWQDAWGDVGLMIAHMGIMVTVGGLVFESVWTD